MGTERNIVAGTEGAINNYLVNHLGVNYKVNQI